MTLTWLVTVILVAILCAGFYQYGRWDQRRKDKKKKRASDALRKRNAERLARAQEIGGPDAYDEEGFPMPYFPIVDQSKAADEINRARADWIVRSVREEGEWYASTSETYRNLPRKEQNYIMSRLEPHQWLWPKLPVKMWMGLSQDSVAVAFQRWNEIGASHDKHFLEGLQRLHNDLFPEDAWSGIDDLSEEDLTSSKWNDNA